MIRPLTTTLATSLLLGCDTPPPAREGPPDIIVVCMDTLRADRLGPYGNEDGLTPNIDRFAAEAVVFEDAWAVANETLYSHAALFTSRYASETGPIFSTFRLDDAPPTLAEVLGIYGYDSAAFTGGGHLGEDFGLGRGFSHYQQSESWGSLYHSVPDALDWMDSRDDDDPTFLFVHGYDTHHRYLKPGPYGYSRVDASYQGLGASLARGSMGTILVVDGHYFPRHAAADLLDMTALRVRGRRERHRIERLSHEPDQGSIPLRDEDFDYLHGIYDGAVSYGDAWFGLLMAGLERRGALDHTVVVLLSDHGEELGEDGLFHHRYTLSDLALKVPLLVRLPGGAQGGRRIEGMVDLTDVMPTLLEAAEAEAPAGIRGRSLWPALQGAALEQRPATFSQTMFRAVSIRTPEGRLSFAGIGADSPYLAEMIESTRLNSPAFEASEGLSEAQRKTMRRDLAAWASALHQPARGGDDTLTPEQLEVMQSKGYWGAQ
jgi:arylsulfatase A-like enzyme